MAGNCALPVRSARGRSALLAACAGVGLVAAPASRAAPDFTRVDVLDGYTPLAIAAGAPAAAALPVAGGLTAASMAPAQAYSDGQKGLALLVWQNGALVYEHYAPGISQATRFETFSMHKSVLGLIYGAALADGVIGALDDPCGRYLAEWRDDPRGRITLRQLLTMQSGLHFYGFADPTGRDIATGTQVTATVLNTALDRPPGTRFEYNNVNSQLAGTILDRALRAAGRGDYASYLSHTLLQPIGAGDAHLWLEHPGGEPRFYADLQMGARDWLRVGILIAQGGRFGGRQVLPEAWIKTATHPSTLNANYGLLIWLGSPWVRWRAYGPDIPIRMSHEKPYLAEDLVYFDGFGGQRVYVSPSRNLVIVRVGQPQAAFDDSVIPNDVVQAVERK